MVDTAGFAHVTITSLGDLAKWTQCYHRLLYLGKQNSPYEPYCPCITFHRIVLRDLFAKFLNCQMLRCQSTTPFLRDSVLEHLRL